MTGPNASGSKGMTGLLGQNKGFVFAALLIIVFAVAAFADSVLLSIDYTAPNATILSINASSPFAFVATDGENWTIWYNNASSGNFTVTANAQDNLSGIVSMTWPATVSAGGTNYSGILPDPSTVGIWHFDENTGTIAHDASPYGHNGTLLNGANWTSGKRNYAVSFDGANAQVSMPSIYYNTQTFSVWFKLNPTSLSRDYALFERMSGSSLDYFQGYRLSVVQNGSLDWNMNIYNPNSTSEIFSSTLVNDSQWHHAVAIINRTNSTSITSSLYVDGQLEGSDTKTVGSYNHNDYLYVGDDTANGGEQHLNGTIDEFVIYNRTLSESEIKALYDLNSLNINFTWLYNWNGSNTLNYTNNSVTVYDAASNSNTSWNFFNVLLDIAAPTTTDDGPTDNVTWYNTSPITINLTAVDNVGGSGVNNTNYDIAITNASGTVYTPMDISYVNPTQVTLSCSATCYEVVEYYSNDKVGNTEATATKNSNRINFAIGSYVDPGVVADENTTIESGSTVYDSGTNLTNATIEGNSTIANSTITDSVVNESTVNSSTVDNSTVFNSTVTDSNITDSNVSDSNVTDSNLTDSTADNSTVEDSVIDNSTVTDSTVNLSTVNDSTVANGSTIDNSTVTDGSSISNSTVDDSAVDNSTITDSTVNDSSTVINSTVANNSVVENSNMTGSTADNSTFTNSTMQNSSASDSTKIRSNNINTTVNLSAEVDTNATNSNLTNADMNLCTLLRSTATNTIGFTCALTDVVATNSSLTNTTVSGGNVTRVTAINSSLTNATLSDSNFKQLTVTCAASCVTSDIYVDPMTIINFLPGSSGINASEPQVSTIDASGFYRIHITNSTVEQGSWANYSRLMRSNVTNSIIRNVSIIDSDIENSDVRYVDGSAWVTSPITGAEFYVGANFVQPYVPIYNSVLANVIAQDSIINQSTLLSSGISTITDSNVQNVNLASNYTITNSTLSNVTLSGNGTIANSTIIDSVLDDTSMYGVTVSNLESHNTTINNSQITNPSLSLNDSIITLANINDGMLLYGSITYHGTTYYGSRTLASIYGPTVPAVSNVQCANASGVFDSCSNFVYGETLWKVRATVTQGDFTISNVAFKLDNLNDSKTLFFGSWVEQNGSNYSFYWNQPLLDSGTFNLTVTATDTQGNSSFDYANWSIPFGT